MAEEISAVAMVAYFGGCVAQLRGRAVYVQFSNHKELKTDQTHSNAVSFVIIIIFNVLQGEDKVKNQEHYPIILCIIYMIFPTIMIRCTCIII